MKTKLLWAQDMSHGQTCVASNGYVWDCPAAVTQRFFTPENGSPEKKNVAVYCAPGKVSNVCATPPGCVPLRPRLQLPSGGAQRVPQ